MGAIKRNHFSGGTNLTQDSTRPDGLADILRDMADDLVAMKAEVGVSRGNALVVDITDLRTKFIAILTALDGDSGVTDTNYAATQSPAALTAAAIVAPSSLVAQLNALRADFVAIRAKVLTFTAKLDLDAGIADANYSALWVPAALTAVAITALSSAATLINQLIADRAALRTTINGITAKLDLDGTVNLTTYGATGGAAAPTAGALSALLTSKV